MSPAADHWPQAAASAAIFRERQVLLAERGRGPRQGLWSLPGGRIEPGETAAAAAVREIKEETNLDVTLQGLLDVHDVIVRTEDGRLDAHFVLAVFYGTCDIGVPMAATDVSDARFVALDDVGAYPLTNGAHRLILAASRCLGIS